MHIAITGNIGAGKTTLAKMLASYYGWEVLYEAVNENPYLSDFYSDMHRWAFHLQIYFLNSRFGQARTILAIEQANNLDPTRQRSVIQDRTIYEDAAIFARNLHQSGYMTDRDYNTYTELFQNMMSLVHPPGLMIYLRADLPKLRQQIQKRGRSFEQSISDEYLLNLNQLYEEFVAAYTLGPLLILDINTLNYVDKPADFTAIVRQIDALVSGQL